MPIKAALFVFAGPEAPCRLVHAIIFARDIEQRGGEATIVLEGAAPQWLLELPNPEHKFHSHYTRAKEEGLIDVVCKACALEAGVAEIAEEEGFHLVGDAMGHVSMARYIEAGFRIITL